MANETSARLNLPMIQPGQAQKELVHNEALSLIDVVAQTAVEQMGTNGPPGAPQLGQAWIVGPSPSGVWTGWAGHIAAWTAGGWRLVAPVEGMSAWVVEAQQIARFSQNVWTLGTLRGSNLVIDGKAVVGPRRGAIGVPTGGGLVDVEGRTAIAAILSALRSHGLIAT